jgi:hypothetical protein
LGVGDTSGFYLNQEGVRGEVGADPLALRPSGWGREAERDAEPGAVHVEGRFTVEEGNFMTVTLLGVLERMIVIGPSVMVVRRGGGQHMGVADDGRRADAAGQGDGHKQEPDRFCRPKNPHGPKSLPEHLFFAKPTLSRARLEIKVSPSLTKAIRHGVAHQAIRISRALTLRGSGRISPRSYDYPPLSRNENEQFGEFRRNKIEQS